MSKIYVPYHQLCGSLDVAGCTALTWLVCKITNLTELDVTGCTALTELYCGDNNLTELDVTGCAALVIRAFSQLFTRSFRLVRM